MTGKQPPTKSPKDDDAAKAARIEEERTVYDTKHLPTDRNTRIDGTGARFKSDG